MSPIPKDRGNRTPTPRQGLDVARVRSDFPILQRRIHGKPLIYFDNAATTQKPVAVLDAMDDYYREHNANVHRGLHALSMEASEMYEAAHETVSDFIHADGMDEVVFTQGTTDAINLVAYAYGLHELKPGDEVLGTVMEHHSNFVPWQQITKLKGATFKHIPITQEGLLDMEAAKRLITKKTKLLTVTAVSNVLGTINPVRELADLAHEKNALVLVDAAQSVPHMPTDVEKLGADLIAFSAHKMLGPTGVGALWGRRDVLEAMQPYRYGGEMIKRVTLDESRWNDLPWKFEAGTPIIAPGIGFAAAVDYLRRIGMDAVRDHELRLTRYAMKRLQELPGMTLYGPSKAEQRGGVCAFTFGDVHAHDVADLLDREGIAVRAGHHCAQPLAQLLDVPSTARASFYLYNHEKEVDKMIDVLQRIHELFQGPRAKETTVR